MKNKILSLVMVLLILLSVVGCAKTNNNSTQKPPEANVQQNNFSGMQLLASYSDTFNPYTANTDINRKVCQLLYEPLVSLDDNFEVIYCLAESVSVQDKVYTVKLVNALFSDNTSVTAEDVVYSYQVAKVSNTAYDSYFYAVKSVWAVDQKTVSFELNVYDPYFANLLTFPIIKKGSDNITDQDGVLFPPIGCGRYVLSENKESLLRNDGYYGKKGSIAQIELINAPDDESVSHYVEIGATDVYFTDFSDGKIVRMSGKKTDVNLNNFVYIGINGNDPQLNNINMRYALSTVIDRTAICQSAYYNNAVAANGFFNPVFAPTSSLQTIKIESDLKITIENLEKIGYNNLDSGGVRVNQHGTRAAFTLLVNSENASRSAAADMISKQAKEAGIEISVIKVTYETYIERLKSGYFQLYLGEIYVLPNMDISPLIIPGAAAAYGRVEENATVTEDETVDIPKASSASEIVKGYYAGNHTIADVATTLITEMSVIPVCYRKGLLFYDSSAVNLASASQSDIYCSPQLGRPIS